MLKKMLLSFLLLPFLGFVDSNQFPIKENTKWVISQNSNLTVIGSTNLNRFSCAILSYPQTDTITLYKVNQLKELPLSGCINLKVADFVCNNKLMTNELRKTLKLAQYPYLHINFISLNEFMVLKSKPILVKGIVDIEIASVKKRYVVNYQLHVDEHKMIHLVGYRDINFSDFELVPPKKLGKLVQAKDKLTVSYHLQMNLVQ
jgi:hypothetical protein